MNKIFESFKEINEQSISVGKKLSNFLDKLASKTDYKIDGPKFSMDEDYAYQLNFSKYGKYEYIIFKLIDSRDDKIGVLMISTHTFGVDKKFGFKRTNLSSTAGVEVYYPISGKYTEFTIKEFLSLIDYLDEGFKKYANSFAEFYRGREKD